MYRGADKSLAQLWKKQDLQHMYRDTDNSLAQPSKEINLTILYQALRRTNNSDILLLSVRRKSWYSVVSLGRCSLFPSRVGLRTYQHPIFQKCDIFATQRPSSEATLLRHSGPLHSLRAGNITLEDDRLYETCRGV